MMDTRARTVALIAMLLTLTAAMYLLFTGGELLRTIDNGPERGEPGWMKPTTGILESMRGIATAEAEKATPEPSAEQDALEIPQPGMKAEPRQSLWDWWEEERLPDNWTSA